LLADPPELFIIILSDEYGIGGGTDGSWRCGVGVGDGLFHMHTLMHFFVILAIIYMHIHSTSFIFLMAYWEIQVVASGLLQLIALGRQRNSRWFHKCFIPHLRYAVLNKVLK
jgi:hypothetical protein